MLALSLYYDTQTYPHRQRSIQALIVLDGRANAAPRYLPANLLGPPGARDAQPLPFGRHFTGIVFRRAFSRANQPLPTGAELAAFTYCGKSGLEATAEYAKRKLTSIGAWVCDDDS